VPRGLKIHLFTPYVSAGQKPHSVLAVQPWCYLCRIYYSLPQCWNLHTVNKTIHYFIDIFILKEKMEWEQLKLGSKRI